jgi:hypothetical protein
MKNSIIKSYASWLNENLLIAEADGVDVNALYKAGDRAKLIEAAMAVDSPEVKAHPAYATTMEWWKRGGADLNLFKSLLKKGSERRADQMASLKSAYYWAGSSSNVTMGTTLGTFYKVADSIIANGAKLGVDPAKIEGLKAAVAGLKVDQQKGFLPKRREVLGAILPLNLIDGTTSIDGKEVDVIAGITSETPNPKLVNMLKAWKIGYYGTPELAKDPASSYQTLKAYQADPAKSNDFWKSGISLSNAQKLEILNTIQAKADAYVLKHKEVDMVKAISIAADLYIAPKAEEIKVTVTEAPTPELPKPITVSYPGAPKSDDDLNSKKGQSLFPDNGITVTPQASTELNEVVKAAVDAVKTAGGTITGIKTWGYSGTSKVGTNYTSATGTGNPALATDRLAAINKTLAAALTANGVTVAPAIDPTRNKANPNQGPEWTDADKANSAKYGTPGARTEEYNKTYGPYRFSIAFMELTFTVSPDKKLPPAATATASGTWKVYMNWIGESITITPPTLRFGGFHSSAPKIGNIGNKMKCPEF